ncbi:hypothetical protein F4777DRAFT_162614 [Nemania sp. FL0916]|nr:hypothetical protein F4777DRAFT_162614 [Nemania sp. FL0916]
MPEGSIFSAKNENNVGHVNFPIDFALVKVEVPKEFHGLGKALSKRRRENAECGPQHITARRLGMLFEQVIPKIDILTAAYGERVSEIATSSEFDLKASDFGPFSGHVGIEGTSIWAAASSGNSVIAIHLLACMLARIFSNAEATAIWYELVQCRIKELEQEAAASDIQGIAMRLAAQIGGQVTRDDLATWDASARAWLEAADQIKRRDDTQLKLIIHNIPSIKASRGTYENVKSNWVVAMTAVQKSIEGIPQSVSDAAVLLGLRSWHIYPNLKVFSPNREVLFNDHLVKAGGTITLGLERPEHEATGVSWSVSLSHLRFYGDPVVISRSSRDDSDRLTVKELRLVAFGSFLSSWVSPRTIDVNEAAECFVALGECLDLDTNHGFYQLEMGWLIVLIDAAQSLLSSADGDRANALDLIEYGRRQGRNFLSDDFRKDPPMFGLGKPYEFFKLSNEPAECGTTESCVAVLRRLARDCGLHRDDCIILPRSEFSNATNEVCSDGSMRVTPWVLASAIALPRYTGKRAQDGTLRTTERHIRWISADHTGDSYLEKHSKETEALCQCSQKRQLPSTECSCKTQDSKCNPVCKCILDNTNIEKPSRSNFCSCEMESDNSFEEHVRFRPEIKPTLKSRSRLKDNNSFLWYNPPEAFAHRYNELCNELSASSAYVPDVQSGRCDTGKRHGNEKDPYSTLSVSASKGIEYRPVWDIDRATMFLTDRAAVDMSGISLSDLTKAFRSRVLSQKLLKSYMIQVKSNGIPKYSSSVYSYIREYPKGREGPEGPEGDVFFASLMALADISRLYRNWPEATILIGITRRPLALAHWASRLEGKVTSRSFHRSTNFACLAMLESGGHNLHPDQLELVMAVAAGNSIYAAESLLQDPSGGDKSNDERFDGIRRIVGSVGHPGVVLLISPPEPRTLELDANKGRFTCITRFDGVLKSTFEETSLHLRLTGLKIPLALAPGAIDADVLFHEAIVSVFDGSRWVADIDILKSLELENIVRRPGCNCKNNTNRRNLGEVIVNSLGDRLQCVSNWDELLICKENLLDNEIGVVQSYGNWFARLAVAAFAASKGHTTIVLPSHSICSDCGPRLVSTEAWSRLKTATDTPHLLIS